MDQQSRRRSDSIEELIEEQHVDAVVLGLPANVLWLTGFEMVGTFYFTAALATPGDPPALLVHRAELDMARSESWTDDVALWGHGEDHVDALGTWLCARLGPLHGRRIGVELDAWLRPRDLDLIAGRLGLDWVDVGPYVERLRQRIEGTDLDRVIAAGRVADMTIAAGACAIAAGRSEQQIASAAQRCYTLAGGQEPPVALSVRSKDRIALSRALPAPRTIQAGDPVALEVWASIHRQAAVSATTVVTGTPARALLDLWQALEAIFATVERADLVELGRSVAQAAGEAARRQSARLHDPLGFGIASAFPLRPTTRWRLTEGAQPPAPGQVITVAPHLTRDGVSVFAARTYHASDGGLAPLTHQPALWSVQA